MKTKKRSRLLAILIAYFAGVLTTVYFLAPGPLCPADVLNPAKWSEIADWKRAGDRVTNATDLTALYAHRAKDYVHDRITAD